MMGIANKKKPIALDHWWVADWAISNCSAWSGPAEPAWFSRLGNADLIESSP